MMKKSKKICGDAQAIKMKIIWTMLKQLTLHTFGDSPRNRKIVRRYDRQWKRLEELEQ